jgi:hypothetical protein
MRAGADEELRDEMVSVLTQMSGTITLTPSANVQQDAQVVDLYFAWGNQVGTLTARVSDEDGQTGATLSCKSVASSLPQARTQALHGLLLTLLDHLQTISESGAVSSNVLLPEPGRQGNAASITPNLPVGGVTTLPEQFTTTDQLGFSSRTKLMKFYGTKFAPRQ